MALEKSHRTIIALFIVIIVGLAAAVVTSLANINRAAESATWVNETHAILNQTTHTLASLHAAESAVQEYLITGESSAQVAYRQSFDQLGENLSVASALTRAQPDHHTQVVALETAVLQRLGRARMLLEAKSNNDNATISRVLAEDGTRAQIDEISRLAEDIENTHASLLAEQDSIAFLRDQRARTLVIATGVLNVLLLIGAAYLVRDDIRARRRAAVLLTQSNEDLTAKVRERTAELEAANVDLKAENLEGRWKTQAVEHQLRYNQLIVNSVSDLVFVITKLRSISRVNPAVGRLTGLDLPSLLNRPLDDLVRLEQAVDSPLDELNHALEAGQDLRRQAAFLAGRGGEDIPVILNAYPMRDHDKVIGGVVTLQLVSVS